MLWSYTCRWHCIRWVQGLWTADNVHMGKLACDCWTCSCKCLFLPQQVPCGEATLRLLTYSSKCFLPGIIELVHANVLFLPQQFPCGEVTLWLLTYSSKCLLPPPCQDLRMFLPATSLKCVDVSYFACGLCGYFVCGLCGYFACGLCG